MVSTVQVCIPNTLRDYFDYDNPGFNINIGARVQVPFRHQMRVGIVVSQGGLPKPGITLKNINAVIDKEPLLTDELLSLCHWISGYYQSPLSEVLPLALPKKYQLGHACFRPKLQAIMDTPPLESPLTLNTEQAIAVSTIKEHLHHYHSFLLQGVTGSGKTEVYLQVIDEVMRKGKQVLILVPEIGLTPQLLSRFRARFSQSMVTIHSGLNETERANAWFCAKEGLAQMVIGTRSAIFAPLSNLGLIVIDEEHDASFKQMEGVRYSARDTALMRACSANIPIILGSATPSLESLNNCRHNKYTLLRLNQKACSTHPLQFELIDVRAQPLKHGLSASAMGAIKTHLDNNNQVLVFINRRGFAPVLLCHQCGWMVDCRACDSHLTVHKQLDKMICHHCGITERVPKQCPSCKSTELIPVGAGTQRVHEFLAKQFPDAAVVRIDRDKIRKKNALAEQLDSIHRGDAQLIVGTQMLAKGHHFPRLSLVVVLDADGGLHHHDFRAVEHLGQLLTQVAGRAGRAELPGQVVIQTHVPNHPLLNVLIQQGYDDFANALLCNRKEAGLPPFHFLALIRAQGASIEAVLKLLHATKDKISAHPVSVMGPAPAPLPRKANRYRMQLLVKSTTRHALKSSLTEVRHWLTMNKLCNGVRWNVDVDPMDLS
jgi:primosomal protein N' (replication factor Y) (superfamily II helicase)